MAGKQMDGKMGTKEKRSGFLDKLGLGKKERPTSQLFLPPRPLSTDLSDPDDQNSLQQNDIQTETMSNEEIEAMFEQMLDDMNLTDEKKEPLRSRSVDEKRKLLQLQKKGSVQRGNRLASAEEFITALRDSQLSYEKLPGILASLRIALTNNPVSWVEDFGDEGLNHLILLLDRCHLKKDAKYERIHQECIKCLRALMNNKVGLKKFCASKRSIVLLAKSLNVKSPVILMDTVSVLAAVCLVPPDGHEKVLEAITISCEREPGDRFKPIIQGLKSKSNDALIIACLQFINALITSPDDLDFRLHLRNEFMRGGLMDIIDEELSKSESKDILRQLKIFHDHKEEDFEEFSQRYDKIRLELDDVNECCELVKNSVLDTPAETYFLSILQHLLCVRDEPVIRVAYYRLIEECVSQIVLHRSGCDPDFRTARRFKIDVEPLIETLVEKAKEENGRASKELNVKLEEAITAKQESEAKIAQLESRLKAYESGGAPPAKSGAPPPPPPPMPGGGGAPPPPPPPMPGGKGGPPPPPPPMPGRGGPPPPPMPGMGGPPPPPMPGGMGGPPPPPPPMAPALPHGMKAKKKYVPGVPMKKVTWTKIDPFSLTANAFWVGTKEEQIQSDDIFRELSSKFSTKPAGKSILQNGNDKIEEKSPAAATATKKKAKALMVLDGKTAQNFAILVKGSNLQNVDMKRCLLQCDESCVTEAVLHQLLTILPPPDILGQLAELKDQRDELHEAEQYLVKLTSINKLVPRLRAFCFKLKFPELLQDIKPELVVALEACDELFNSKKLLKILELILLMGNYMNAGSKDGNCFGFDIKFLSKMNETKANDNKTTLLQFLALVCESKFPELLSVNEELGHSDKAARVSVETLAGNLKSMEDSLKQLELNLANFPATQTDDDKFAKVMTPFLKDAKEQCDILDKMYKKLDSSYAKLGDYLAFNPKKYPLDAFFTDIHQFATNFQNAAKENRMERELAEKRQRVKEDQENRERMKQERQAKKKALVDMSDDENQKGVMDSLLEALNTGSAFNREKGRKRAPRAVGAARQAQLNRSRSRSGLVLPSSPSVHDISIESLLMGNGNHGMDFGGVIASNDLIGPPKPRRQQHQTRKEVAAADGRERERI